VRMLTRLLSGKGGPQGPVRVLVPSALLSLAARAQVAGETLSGSVIDTSGAGVPAAHGSIKYIQEHGDSGHSQRDDR
jgi:hypothetical protein